MVDTFFCRRISMEGSARSLRIDDSVGHVLFVWDHDLFVWGLPCLDVLEQFRRIDHVATFRQNWNVCPTAFSLVFFLVSFQPFIKC